MTDSVLYLNLDSNQGFVSINETIPQENVMRLTKVCITWNTLSDSTNAGSLINLELGMFNHSKINSNRSVDISALPLYNDITKQVSLYTVQMPISIVDDISQTFYYKITKKDGSLVNNLSDLQICLAYRP